MEPIKPELVALLQKALSMEHAAAVQYYAHAQLISGPASGPIIALLEDTAKDEHGHAEKLRSLLGDFLMVAPTMEQAPTHSAGGLSEILEVNVATEKEAVNVYQQILDILTAGRTANDPVLSYFYHKAEHDIRHILIEECEHISELARLMR